jgi:hypothetical protein
MKKISEHMNKENKLPQAGHVEIEWPQTDLSEFDDLDTATAIWEAHDDPC